MLSKQTTNALMMVSNSTASLIDPLNEGLFYVLTSCFQSVPLERRSSKYRQISGGRFLVGLR